MPYAYTGRVLNVDLSTGRIREDPLNFEWARKYIGGKGLGARYLFSWFPAALTPWARKTCSWCGRDPSPGPSPLRRASTAWSPNPLSTTSIATATPGACSG